MTSISWLIPGYALKNARAIPNPKKTATIMNPKMVIIFENSFLSQTIVLIIAFYRALKRQIKTFIAERMGFEPMKRL